MDVPIDHEAKTADLITDIFGPALHRFSDVFELVRRMESTDWWEEWSEEPVEAVPLKDAEPLSKWLTCEEDDELRHLNQMAIARRLRGAEVERMIELRLRDRRKEVRPPRRTRKDAKPK